MIASSPNFWFGKEESCKANPWDMHNLSPRRKKLFEKAFNFNSVLLADAFLKENGISTGLKGCTPQWEDKVNNSNDDKTMGASLNDKIVRASLLPPIQIICDEQDASGELQSFTSGSKENEVEKQEIDLPRL